MIIDYSEVVTGPENIVVMPESSFITQPLVNLETAIYIKGSLSNVISINGSLSEFAAWIAPAGGP